MSANESNEIRRFLLERQLLDLRNEEAELYHSIRQHRSLMSASPPGYGGYGGRHRLLQSDLPPGYGGYGGKHRLLQTFVASEGLF